MGEMRAEFEHLKIRIGLHEAKKRITIIDKANHSNWSGTVREGFDMLRRKLEQPGTETHIIHVVDWEKERRHKLEPGTQTAMKINFGTNDLYRQVYAEHERIISTVKNLTMARHIIGEAIRDVLRALDDGELELKMHDGEGEVPEWMQ